MLKYFKKQSRPKVSFSNPFSTFNSKQQQNLSYFQKLKKRSIQFLAGRNGLTISINIGKIYSRLIIGVFEQFSNWYYIFTEDFTGSTDVIKNVMIFFLVTQSVIQILAWGYILAMMELEKDDFNDVDLRTMNEKNLIIWLLKALKYNFYNFTIILVKMVKKLPQAVLITILTQIKMLPLVIHLYFMKYHSIVLTSEILKHMEYETQLEIRHWDNTRKQKFNNQQLLTQDTIKVNFPKKKDKKHKYDVNKLNSDNQHSSNNEEKDVDNYNFLLDANLENRTSTFIFEADIERYQVMSDTIQSIFESMPMSILIYLNNEIYFKERWNNIFVSLKFVSSILTVCMYCIALVITLFQHDAMILNNWRIKLQSLKDLKKNNNQFFDQNYKNRQQTFQSELEIVEKQDNTIVNCLYPLPRNVKINNQNQLLKLQYCTSISQYAVKKYIIDLSCNKSEKKHILESLEQIIKKLPNQHKAFDIQLQDCDLGFTEINNLFYYFTYTDKISKLELNLSENEGFSGVSSNKLTRLKSSISELKKEETKIFFKIQRNKFKYEKINLIFNKSNVSNEIFVELLECSSNILELNLSYNQNLTLYFSMNQLFSQEDVFDMSLVKKYDDYDVPQLNCSFSKLILHFIGCPLSNESLINIFKIINEQNTSIQHLYLDISKTHFQDHFGLLFYFISKPTLQYLTELYFNCCSNDMRQTGFEAIIQGFLLCCPNIKILVINFQHNLIEYQKQNFSPFQDSLQSISETNKLEYKLKELSLNLDENLINENFLNHLTQNFISCFWQIKNLNLSFQSQYWESNLSIKDIINFFSNLLQSSIINHMQHLCVNFQKNLNLCKYCIGNILVKYEINNKKTLKDYLQDLLIFGQLENNYMEFVVTKLPAQQSSFALGDSFQFYINENYLLNLPSQELTKFSSDIMIIGRENTFNDGPDIIFSNLDLSISRIQLVIKQIDKKLYVQDFGKNSSGFKLDREKWKIKKGDVIILGKGTIEITIQDLYIPLQCDSNLDDRIYQVQYIMEKEFQEISFKKNFQQYLLSDSDISPQFNQVSTQLLDKLINSINKENNQNANFFNIIGNIKNNENENENKNIKKSNIFMNMLQKTLNSSKKNKKNQNKIEQLEQKLTRNINLENQILYDDELQSIERKKKQTRFLYYKEIEEEDYNDQNQPDFSKQIQEDSNFNKKIIINADQNQEEEKSSRELNIQMFQSSNKKLDLKSLNLKKMEKSIIPENIQQNQGFIQFKILQQGKHHPADQQPYIIDIGESLSFGKGKQNDVRFENSIDKVDKISDFHFQIGLSQGGWYIQESAKCQEHSADLYFQLKPHGHSKSHLYLLKDKMVINVGGTNFQVNLQGSCKEQQED